MDDLGRLKDYLGVKSATVKHDATLGILERGAWAFVAARTGRYFGPPEVTTEYLGGLGGRELWLRDAVAPDEVPDPAPDPPEPAAYTVAVTVDGTALEPEAFALRLHPRSPRLVLADPDDYWPAGVENIAATYRRGYALGEEPADILSGVLGLAAVRFRRLGLEGIASEAVGTGDYAVSLPASHVFADADVRLVPMLESTLALWRRRNV